MGMPLKIAIAMLVIVTMTPLVMGMVDNAETSMSSVEAEGEAEELVEAIARAYYGGVGCEESVEVSLPDGESIEVGGDGAYRYVVRILEGEAEIGRIHLNTPSVPVLSGTLRITGDCTVTVTCVSVDGVYGVSVAV